MTKHRAVAGRAAAAAGPGARRATSTTSSTPSSRAPITSIRTRGVAVDGEAYDLGNGHVVIAAITTCTNTSNPSVLVAAGLVARKARAKGSPASLGSRPAWRREQVVTDYLDARALARISTRWASTWSAMAARPASAIRGRYPTDNKAIATRSGRRSVLGVIATSRAAYHPTGAPTISPRRRWSSPTRSQAGDRPGQRAVGTATKGEPVFLNDIWPTNEEIRSDRPASSIRRMFRRTTPTFTRAMSAGRRSS